MRPLSLLLSCDFVKTADAATLAFDALVLGGSALALLWVGRQSPRLALRFLVMATGVLAFELFTAPMWLNERLGRFAYVYHDVSWVFTVGWAATLLAVTTFVDRRWPAARALPRFVLTVALFLPIAVIEELVAVQLGVRSYAPEVWQNVSGTTIGSVPVEILFYVPVFASLVLAFYKFWMLVLDDAALVPVRRRRWLRSLVIATIAVFFYEVMTEAMVQNVGFPSWSYFWHDLSWLLLGFWIAVIAVAAVIVQRWMLGWPIPLRFAAGLGMITAVVLPVEIWLIQNGQRVYGPSAVENLTGFAIGQTGVAIEVAFAIPIYLALVISFIRYWEIVMDNEL